MRLLWRWCLIALAAVILTAAVISAAFLLAIGVLAFILILRRN